MGEEALFSSAETYAFSEALTPLQVCHIPRGDFLKLLMDYPSISLKLLEEFNRRMVRVSHQAASDGAGSVLMRLSNYLLELSAAQDSLTVTLPLSMKELAAFLDTTPETLSRRICYLEKEGILTKKGWVVTIARAEALAGIK